MPKTRFLITGLKSLNHHEIISTIAIVWRDFEKPLKKPRSPYHFMNRVKFTFTQLLKNIYNTLKQTGLKHRAKTIRASHFKTHAKLVSNELFEKNTLYLASCHIRVKSIV